MTTYSRGDVVLVPFPYAELDGAKKRPALVVSTVQYNRRNKAAIIAQITSKIHTRPRVGDYRIVDWDSAGLIAPSLLRAHLATVDNSLIVRKLGELPSSEMTAIDELLAGVLGLSTHSAQ